MSDQISKPNQRRRVLSDSQALREMLAIALPSVATMASYTLMQFSDKLMVSRIGPEPVYVSAQSNGGILVWTLIAFVLGLTGVVNSFVSQNLGAGKPERGAAYAWNALAVCGVFYLLFILPSVMLVGSYFEYVHDGEDMSRLVTLETDYTKVLLLGTFAVMGARTIHHYFYGLHRPWVVFISAVVGNVINVVLNIMFIFGDQPLSFEAGWISESVINPACAALASLSGSLGIEPMGLVGAAWATVVGGVIELLIPLALFVSPKYARMYGTRKAWRLSKDCLKGIMKVGVAPGMMFVNEIVCWNMLMVWLVPKGGQAMGDDPVLHNTTGWIALQYMHLSFMPAVGLSIACQAMVGKAMGMGRPDIAVRRTALALTITMAYMGVCALVFVLFPEQLLGVFIDGDTSPAQRERLIEIGVSVMIAAAVFQLFDALAITTSAALRGAGDTVWPGIATIVLSWGCIVGGGLLMIELFPSWGSLGPWIGASLYIVALGVVLGVRFLGGKWKTMSLVEEDDSDETDRSQGIDHDPFDDVLPDPTVTAEF